MKRTTRALITLILCTSMAASLAAADRPNETEGPPRQLYALGDAAPPKTGRPLLPDAAEEFLIQVEPAAVAANPPSFHIDLPGHGLIEAVRTQFADYRPDWKSWFGDLRYADNGESVGAIHIGFHGDRITALVELEHGERFRIVGGPEDSQRLVRIDPELTPVSCGVMSSADAAGAVEPPLRRQRERSGKQGKPRLLTEKITSCSASARIDVLAVYPSRGNGTLRGYFELTEAEEIAFRTFIDNSISRANQVFINNGILNASYHLVGVVPLINRDNTSQPPMPATGLVDALDWMNDQHTELTNLRNAFGADVVVGYIPFNWSGGAHPEDAACAIANLRWANDTIELRNGVRGPFNGRAFSVHRDSCGLDDLTLAHEIGHNFGMRHDTDTDTQNFRYPWAQGYRFAISSTENRATVMGCACTSSCAAGPNAVCNRIPFFSDPDKFYNNNPNIPIGTPLRHNARVACDEVAGYAALKAAVTNTPPRPSLTVSCSGLTCSFRATAADNATIPSTNYYWDFGDGSPVARSTRTYTYTYASAGARRAHVVVKDAGGQTGVASATANTWVPAYEGGHEASNCGTIYGWAWDQTLPNTPIDVDIYRDGGYTATVTANLYGQDLYNAGKGNGYHRFNYTPSSAWFDGQWHTATVRFAGTSTDLAGTGQPVICGASLFPYLTPTESSSTGGQVYTVGTQFSSNRSGYIVELGFYRASGETGTNTLRLWNNYGQELASVPTSCTSSGWCWGWLSQGVYITAGTQYRVTVNTNTYQVKTGCGIGGGITNDPLTAHSGYWAAGDTFPNNGSCSNFFVDVKFNM